MVPEIEAKSEDADKYDSDIEFVPEIAEDFHVLSELDSDPCQEIAPDQGADKGEDTEDEKVRPKNSCWEGDECSDYGKHSANEESHIAVLGDPLVSQFQLF